MKHTLFKNTLKVRIFLLLISYYSTSIAIPLLQQLENDSSEQEIPIWKEQLEYVNKNNANDNIRLVNYAYKGTIRSEDEKALVIERLFSDTTSIVQYVDNKTFEIIPLKVAKRKGKDGLAVLKGQLEVEITIGVGLVEVEWYYNGNTYYSLIIASSEHGGIIYDHIGHLIKE